MPLPLNPYTAGDPVGKTSYFVGRADVLREVERVLRAPNQNAITLHGQRRIGKTSVLQYLEAHLPELGNYRPVYFDLMNKAGMTLDEIVLNLARTIALRLKLPDPVLGDKPADNFHASFLPEVLASLPANTSLVLLLDEFDVLADPQAEQQIKTRFFGYLRDLRQLDVQRLQFVFVLGRNVDDLDVVARGLFKDLPSYRVSLFSEKDAEALVRLSERDKTLTWSAESVKAVWQFISGHPYLTQALCYQVWEDAYEESESPAIVQVHDIERAIPGAMQRSQNMFTWLWDGLGPAEKVAAAALAGAGQTIVDEDRLGHILSESGVRILIGELRDAPRKLKDWDILAPADGGYIFRVEILRYWIAENKPLSRTWEELDRINPVADNLYNAAYGLYRANNLPGATSLLRQALDNNPNHLRALELLAEILLTAGELDQAQSLLEQLLELNPSKARSRLKQVYGKRAEYVSNSDEKLYWLEKALQLAPDDRHIMDARRTVYRHIGARLEKEYEFSASLDAYQAADDHQSVERVHSHIRVMAVQKALNEIKLLKQKRAYQEAYQQTLHFMASYPTDHDWQNELNWLEQARLLGDKYKQALGAIKDGNREDANRLLAEIIAIDPDYEQANKLAQDELENTESAASLTTIFSYQALSIWNFRNYLLILWSIFINPKKYYDLNMSHGEANVYRLTNRISLTLTHSIFLIPLLGDGLFLYGTDITLLFSWMIILAGGVLWLIGMLTIDFWDKLRGLALFLAKTVLGVLAFLWGILLSLFVGYVLTISGAFELVEFVWYLSALLIIIILSTSLSLAISNSLMQQITSAMALGGIFSIGFHITIALFMLQIGLKFQYDGVMLTLSGNVLPIGWESIFILIVGFLISVLLGTFFVFLGGWLTRLQIKHQKPQYIHLVLLAINWITIIFFSFGGALLVSGL